MPAFFPYLHKSNKAAKWLHFFSFGCANQIMTIQTWVILMSIYLCPRLIVVWHIDNSFLQMTGNFYWPAFEIKANIMFLLIWHLKAIILLIVNYFWHWTHVILRTNQESDAEESLRLSNGVSSFRGFHQEGQFQTFLSFLVEFRWSVQMHIQSSYRCFLSVWIAGIHFCAFWSFEPYFYLFAFYFNIYFFK